MYFLHPAGVPNSSARLVALAPPRSPQQAFGARVRDLRLARELTQEDLAEHCGLFRTYMSRIETGNANPTLTMIWALAGALGVNVADLFPDPPAPTEPPTGSNRKRGNPPSRGRVR